MLDEEQAELLGFVTRMAGAAESRDLMGPGSGPGQAAGAPGASVSAGFAFPPLKRRIKSIPPERAAVLWIERFRVLADRGAGPGAGRGAGRGRPAGKGGGGKPDEAGA